MLEEPLYRGDQAVKLCITRMNPDTVVTIAKLTQLHCSDYFALVRASVPTCNREASTADEVRLGDEEQSE